MMRLHFLSYLMLILLAAACRQATPPASDTTFAPLSHYDTQARALLAQMTLEEKIGQMIQAEQAFRPITWVLFSAEETLILLQGTVSKLGRKFTTACKLLPCARV